MADPSSSTPRDAESGDACSDWVDAHDTELLPEAVLETFEALAGSVEMRPLAGGLLHRSFHLRTKDADFVVQRVSDVFAPEIHDNIQAVSAHLTSRGLSTTSLVPTREGDLSADLGSLGRWRLMPHLGGASFEKLQSVAQARSAGVLVGRFHAALRDFHAPLAPMGIPYRDTPRYLAALRSALETHRSHRLAPEMSALGARVLSAFEVLGPAPEVADRVVHGDLKVANLLFEGAEAPARDRAFAVIDLDTLMRGPLWMELGDAWRSWCNPAGEERDGGAVQFEMAYFEASLRGFVEGYQDTLSEEERDSLEAAPERMILELCARFVTDALEEHYFAWDEARFPARGEHNAARAVGQWALFEAAGATRSARASLLGEVG